MSFASLDKHQPPILENAKLLVKNKLLYLSENWEFQAVLFIAEQNILPSIQQTITNWQDKFNFIPSTLL